MNQGQQRIPCPRCRANNFLGTTHCWQCGGSLPPPEAVGQATMPVSASPHIAYPSPDAQHRTPNAYYPSPYDAAAVRRSSRRLMLIPILFLVLIGLGALFVLAFQSRTGSSVVPGLNDAQARMNAYADRLRREMDGSAAESGETDPLAAQARREIERLSGQIGGLAPPSDPQGRVHLRSGGAISREQWERARDSLRATP